MPRDQSDRYGICRICGFEGKLSFEHVPPRATFNNLLFARSSSAPPFFRRWRRLMIGAHSRFEAVFLSVGEL
jgi:hypothetical protein